MHANLRWQFRTPRPRKKISLQCIQPFVIRISHVRLFPMQYLRSDRKFQWATLAIVSPREIRCSLFRLRLWVPKKTCPIVKPSNIAKIFSQIFIIHSWESILLTEYSSTKTRTSGQKKVCPNRFVSVNLCRLIEPLVSVSLVRCDHSSRHECRLLRLRTYDVFSTLVRAVVILTASFQFQAHLTSVRHETFVP